ncbi:Hypothetical predicted protein, partial [Olea europaea subsp. europaea]
MGVRVAGDKHRQRRGLSSHVETTTSHRLDEIHRQNGQWNEESSTKGSRDKLHGERLPGLGEFPNELRGVESMRNEAMRLIKGKSRGEANKRQVFRNDNPRTAASSQHLALIGGLWRL